MPCAATERSRRLDTFLDLQEEHTRLQNRVAELRARAPRSPPASPASSNASSQTSMYATTSMVLKRPLSTQSPQTYPPSPVDEISPSPASNPSHFDSPAPAAPAKNEDDDDQLKKKKVSYSLSYFLPSPRTR